MKRKPQTSSFPRHLPDPNHDKLEGGSGNTDHDLDQRSRGNKSISMTLSDSDLLDCPICFEILSVPVFQCENGHIACASYCFNIANKCPIMLLSHWIYPLSPY